MSNQGAKTKVLVHCVLEMLGNAVLINYPTPAQRDELIRRALN